MTRTFALDDNNDLYLGTNDSLAMATGLAAVVQLATGAAETILGECVLAADDGLPYFQALWKGSPNLAQFEAALRLALLAVPDVTGITALQIRLDGEAVRYAATIQTIYGPGALNG